MSAAFHEVSVTSVRHWTDALFSFETTRPPSLRFRNGEFVMVGRRMEDGRPLARAYSIASPNHGEALGFYSIKVPGGPLTSRLRHVEAGDTLLVGSKPVGTLVLDNLLPGRRLYLLATGTGLAPFLSLAADPEVHEAFETVVLVHGCRVAADLEYGFSRLQALRQDKWMGAVVREKLVHAPIVTREPYALSGRIPDLIRSGRLAAVTGQPPLDPASDRAMLCGNPQMLADGKALLEELGFSEGSAARAGEFVVERAFVEKQS